MSAKHKVHRPGKASAVSDPTWKIGACRSCGFLRMLPKSTGLCGRKSCISRRGAS